MPVFIIYLPIVHYFIIWLAYFEVEYKGHGQLEMETAIMNNKAADGPARRMYWHMLAGKAGIPSLLIPGLEKGKFERRKKKKKKPATMPRCDRGS